MKHKYIKQGILAIFEVLLVTCLCTYFSSFLRPICDWLETVERISFFFIVYEIITYFFSRNMLDARKDALLAYITFLKASIYFCETRYDGCKNYIISTSKGLLSNKTFLHADIKEKVTIIADAIDNDSLSNDALERMNMLLIIAEHEYEEIGLTWNFTILVKLMK